MRAPVFLWPNVWIVGVWRTPGTGFSRTKEELAKALVANGYQCPVKPPRLLWTLPFPTHLDDDPDLRGVNQCPCSNQPHEYL